MKVKCINSEWESETFWERLKEKLFGRNKPDPIEGHVYDVYKKERCYYFFEEFGLEEGYRMEWFIPVDGESNKEEMKEVEFTEIKKKIPAQSQN